MCLIVNPLGKSGNREALVFSENFFLRTNYYRKVYALLLFL